MIVLLNDSKDRQRELQEYRVKSQRRLNVMYPNCRTLTNTFGSNDKTIAIDFERCRKFSTKITLNLFSLLAARDGALVKQQIWTSIQDILERGFLGYRVGSVEPLARAISTSVTNKMTSIDGPPVLDHRVEIVAVFAAMQRLAVQQ